MKKLFVHIPKNGGTSLRQKRINNVIINDYKNSGKINAKDSSNVLNPLGLTSTFGHIRLKDFDCNLEEVQPFCIVRNPWSREVSKYKFLLNSLNIKTSKVANRRKLISEFGHKNTLTFEEYFEIRHKFLNVQYTWLHAVENFFPQIDYMTDDNDIVKTDVLRFEHYSKDIFNYLEIKNLSKANDMKTENWKKYYTNDTIQLVADLYQKDIEYFGFDFDTSAQKNYWTK